MDDVDRVLLGVAVSKAGFKEAQCLLWGKVETFGLVLRPLLLHRYRLIIFRIPYKTYTNL